MEGVTTGVGGAYIMNSVFPASTGRGIDANPANIQPQHLCARFRPSRARFKLWGPGGGSMRRGEECCSAADRFRRCVGLCCEDSGTL